MLKSRSIAWVAVALLSLTGAARADKVANPQYEQWSKFKPGAFAKIDGDTVAAGTTSKSSTTTKLLEITPDKLTLEVSTTVTAMGQNMAMPPQKIDVPATVEKAVEPADKPKTTTGEETVKVGSKDIKATWTESVSSINGMAVTAKTWISPEV